MNENWDLDILYKGFSDPAYEADIAECEAEFKRFKEILDHSEGADTLYCTEAILSSMEKGTTLMNRLFSYASLRQSVATDDGEVMAQNARLMRMYAEVAGDMARSTKYLGRIENAETLAKQSEKINTYLFLIGEAKKQLSHMLSDEAEAIISAMDVNGGGAWGQLQSFLTSTLKVDYKGGTVTLSEIRNLAYSADAEERAAAYEAELAAYAKIADSVAFALNNIKNQVTTLVQKRGYDCALTSTLESARMKKETLDAMMTAINEYLPAFRRYFRMKGKLLGDENGLKWYNLFAPIGTNSKCFTAEEAKEYLVTCFEKLSPEVAEMMARAFDESWIDFYPRSGKEGGAFCAELTEQKQSRILTNFDGSFSAVDTLAHELGHAFHNRQIQDNAVLNRGYPMPVAETASTFNEVHLGEYALAGADNDEEKLNLLDSTLRESAQCVVDIYSRYLFESRVFEESRGRFLMADDLNTIMLDSQKQAYGDGLDENFLNSGMWICKSHYYSSGLSFYNFPYAFGNLFAQGLYALYKERDESFMADYKEMLRLTPVHSMEENAAMMGIDLTKPDFWRKSLQLIEEQIDEFCRLAE